MSFFSNLKERATAGLKAAEKYIAVDDKRKQEASNVERKPAQSDPLQAVVQQAVAEEVKKKQDKDQTLARDPPEVELNKLKGFIRAKLTEHEQVVEEYKGREKEYQRLLQENESEKHKSVAIINEVNQRYAQLEHKYNQTAQSLADVQSKAAAPKPHVAEPELNIDVIRRFLSTKQPKAQELQTQLAGLFYPKQDIDNKI